MKKIIPNDVSDEELDSFIVAVKARYGIDFSNYELKSLKRGFVRLLSKNQMYSFLDLWKVLLRDRTFIYSCIDELTVNMTEFYRNPDAWKVIYRQLKKHFLLKKTIAIWHAGCSSGEEVYSMAFMLNVLKLSYRSQLYATDLNLSVLEKAKGGRYPSISKRKCLKNFSNVFPDLSLDQMLIPEDESSLEVMPKLRKNINFKKHNLVHEDYPIEQDIIFCRNVMIYFDERLKETTIKKMHASLKDNGLFVIGYFDAIPSSLKHLFVPVDSSARVYKKR